MRNHLENFWGAYVFAFCIMGFMLLITSVTERAYQRHKACYDRGMVVVDTDAGPRCASVFNLYEIGQ